MVEDARKPKVAIYIRVSTKFQIDKDSLKVQRRELISYCKLVLNCNDYEVFEDAGFSAKNTDRPDYQAMMTKLRTRQYTHLLVWKIDRISRNLIDFANMYAELKELGVDFVSKNEQFDTSTAMGEAMLKIILVFAELERKITSERVSAVLKSRASNGQWNGGKAPYGYRYNKKTDTFSIDESEASVVRRIFLLYEIYESTGFIVSILNASGIKSPKDSKWTDRTVKLILTGDFYIGTYTYNRFKAECESDIIRIENHHPSIVSKETFDRIQPSLNKPYDPAVSLRHQKSHIYVFSGLLTCGNCGRPGMEGHHTVYKGKAETLHYISYICGNAESRSRKARTCSCRYTKEDDIAVFVLTIIYNILLLQEGGIKHTTNISVIQESLLRGIDNADKITINTQALSDIKRTIRTDDTMVELSVAFRGCESYTGAIDDLKVKRLRYENAKQNLKAMRDTVPEHEYTTDMQEINAKIDSLSENIARLEAEVGECDSDDTETQNKATLLLLEKSIESGDPIDIKQFIACANKEFQKCFFRSLVEDIVITDARVTQITFLSGLTLKFTYKN